MKNFDKVPMPEYKVITVRSNPNKIPYVYYFTKSFRNEKGQPDNKRIIIGRLSEEDNMLIPNRNYFEIYNLDITKKSNFDLSGLQRFGIFLLFNKITKDLKLDKILKYAFPKIHNKILNIVMYMLSSDKSMFYLDDWCEENYTYDNLIITSQQSSEIFKNINRNNKNVFFKKWIENNKKDEYLAFDVTSISSYSKNNELVEWGYNRDDEDLPQINIGTFYGEKSKLPIYYNNYSGSIVDKTYLPFMMQGTKDLNIKISKFVMDKGFYSEDNLKYMLEEGLKFIVCMSENKITKDFINKKGDEVKSSANYILNFKMYGHSYDFKLEGYKNKIHIFYDYDKLSLQENELYNTIDKYERELKILKELDKKAIKKYSKYFEINVGEVNSFSYKKDFEKIDQAHKLLGYFMCITNDLSLSSEEIITIYRQKDVVEKHFDNLKNYTDGKRSRTHYTDTFEGKLFINFISLIYKSQIEIKLKEYFIKNNSTVDKILIELSKIKKISVNGTNRLYQPLTRKQKDILELFGISDTDVNSMIKTL